jgi:hypothetical protein
MKNFAISSSAFTIKLFDAAMNSISIVRYSVTVSHFHHSLIFAVNTGAH